jgi:hypothetical protein
MSDESSKDQTPSTQHEATDLPPLRIDGSVASDRGLTKLMRGIRTRTEALMTSFGRINDRSTLVEEQAAMKSLTGKQADLDARTQLTLHRIATADAEAEVSREDLPGETLLSVHDEELHTLITEDSQQLATLLANTKLYPTNKTGAYLRLYTPIPETEGNPSLAVKVFDTESAEYKHIESPLESQTDDAELQAVLDPPTNIVFMDKQNPQIDDLNPTERKFLLLAMEHMKHQELYGKFVKPAVFVVYPAPYADLSEPMDHLARNQEDPFANRLLQSYIGQERLTSDYRYIVHKRGEIMYTMVQEYVDLGPNVFNLDKANITQAQKDQLREFADTVQSTYENYGYFPDPSMWKPDSGNLRFDKDGQLVLIDTNSLRNQHQAYTDSPETLLSKLRQLYESGEESSQQ